MAMKHQKKLPGIYFRYDPGKLPEEKLRPVRNWKSSHCATSSSGSFTKYGTVWISWDV